MQNAKQTLINMQAIYAQAIDAEAIVVLGVAINNFLYGLEIMVESDLADADEVAALKAEYEMPAYGNSF